MHVRLRVAVRSYNLRAALPRRRREHSGRRVAPACGHVATAKAVRGVGVVASWAGHGIHAVARQHRIDDARPGFWPRQRCTRGLAWRARTRGCCLVTGSPVLGRGHAAAAGGFRAPLSPRNTRSDLLLELFSDGLTAACGLAASKCERWGAFGSLARRRRVVVPWCWNARGGGSRLVDVCR